MLKIGLFTMIVVLLCCTWAIPVVFGNEFVESSEVLFILALCIPIRFMIINIGGLLSVKDNIRSKALYLTLVTLTNIGLNALLIPSFSYYGAAVAAVITEVLLLLIYLFAIHRRFFGNDTFRGWFVTHH